MAEIDAIRICSSALVLLGEEPIESFEGGSAPQAAAFARYQPLADELLGGHPWRFNRSIAVLNRLEAEPPAAAGFSAGYQLPGQCFQIIAPFINACAAEDWEVFGQTLYIDAGVDDEVSLRYHGRADETLWTPAFTTAVTYRLAGDLAMPVRDDKGAAEFWMKAAEQWLAKARHRGATEQPGQPIPAVRLQAMRLR